MEMETKKRALLDTVATLETLAEVGSCPHSMIYLALGMDPARSERVVMALIRMEAATLENNVLEITDKGRGLVAEIARAKEQVQS
jgi:predicted transcriptional regulator